MSDRELPPLLLEGIRLFNQEEFFECHEVLEELWAETIGEEKRFYQGLIQAAVALFHFGNENLGGARKVYLSMREKLEPYTPQYLGIDVGRFLAEMETCFRELLEAESYPTGVQLRDALVPRIHFADESSS